MGDFVLELRRDDPDEHGHPTGFLWLKQADRPGQPGVACFHTRERGHGYVFLPAGSYTMEHSTMTHFKDVQCLRPVGLADPKLSACLIHPITRHVFPPDTPDALEGCIAPFLFGAAEMKGSSDEAMNMIWQILGGWQKGKTVTLVIANNVGGA